MNILGEQKTTLTGQGKEIKKIIKSGSQLRMSHVSTEHAEKPTCMWNRPSAVSLNTCHYSNIC